MHLTAATVTRFRKKIYDYYSLHGRSLPWRKRPTPYRVLVSEIMLQQTQVGRVLDRYKQFLAVFPDFRTLAEAPLHALLKIWSGMGYNRRALALRSLARAVMVEHQGKLPSELDALLALPGIGRYTAGAVKAFAFNQPVVFLDTNIRRVYLHEFFRDKHGIRDDQLLPLVKQTLDTANPRKWFNALMDYGAMLGCDRSNPNRRSAHYERQSPFKNSNRQIRGNILKALLDVSSLSEAEVVRKTGADSDRVKKNLVQLEKEGFIKKRKRSFSICREKEEAEKLV
jgi:A/G-specific adenine glycosylase